jgi:hypothetical protein
MQVTKVSFNCQPDIGTPFHLLLIGCSWHIDWLWLSKGDMNRLLVVVLVEKKSRQGVDDMSRVVSKWYVETYERWGTTYLDIVWCWLGQKVVW